MSLMGLWRMYRPGEIYKVLENLIADLTREGKWITAYFPGKALIHSGEELAQGLRRCERQEGIPALLDLLGCGLELNGQPQGPRVRIFLRFPEGTERERELFKDLIANSMMRDALEFTERFFRNRNYSLFPSRLERALRRHFGFQFEYKIILEPSTES